MREKMDALREDQVRGFDVLERQAEVNLGILRGIRGQIEGQTRLVDKQVAILATVARNAERQSEAITRQSEAIDRQSEAIDKQADKHERAMEKHTRAIEDVRASLELQRQALLRALERLDDR